MKYLLVSITYVIVGILLYKYHSNMLRFFYGIINHQTVQNFFKIFSGLVAITAIIISIQTYRRTVVFGNRPIPKIILEQDGDSFLKIKVVNRGQNPLTEVKVIYKFLPVESNSPVENKALKGKACIGLLEREDDASVFTTRYKISDLSPESGFIFFFIGINSEALYKEKTFFEEFYFINGEKKLYRLNDNYGALGEEHRKMVRGQLEHLNKEILKQTFKEFCLDKIK